MRIGIGLPNPVPDTDGDTLVKWARRAEGAGFSSLATIDRIVYPSYDSLISLAAAAAVTERIGLMTNILIAPLRDESAAGERGGLGGPALRGAADAGPRRRGPPR